MRTLKKELTSKEMAERMRIKYMQMCAMQRDAYDVKVRKAKRRINDFIYECDQKGFNTHVSVGGLDSITLLCLIRSMGIDIPAISVSCLEDKSIIKVHRQLGVIMLSPSKSKSEVIREEGFPVISKKIAGKIMALQNPTEKNEVFRKSILTGECGERGGHTKTDRAKLPQKWLELFGGYVDERYQIPPFKVSNKCCEIMKEKPCDEWAKQHNSKPFLGLMASEGGQRKEALIRNGCNYFGKKVIRSAPFAPFLRQDILRLAKDLKVPVPEIYGTIERDENGNLYTTGADRTGCEMCGFGVHTEKRPHRFDRLYERNPKAWHYWMHECCKDEDGNAYGWGLVLDYIGVQWKQERGDDE